MVNCTTHFYFVINNKRYSNVNQLGTKKIIQIYNIHIYLFLSQDNILLHKQLLLFITYVLVPIFTYTKIIRIKILCTN